MPESSVAGAPETGIEPCLFLEAPCAIQALAAISGDRQGETSAYECNVINCKITAFNDPDDITHITHPGTCQNTSALLYNGETMLPDLLSLGL